jgi:type I restriction enzyme, S subunit
MNNPWESFTLEDVVEVASGQVDPTEPPYSDMPHVGGDNIESETGRLASVGTARELGLTSGKYLFDEKDVLYSKIRPALNKVVAPDFKGICSADIYPIRPLNGKLCREYLVYLLRSQDFLSYATKHSSRTNIPKINREALLAYAALIPPLPEQRRIAAILDKADRLRRIRRYALELGDGFDRAAHRQFFGDPRRNAKNWPVAPLGEECERVTVGFVGTMVNEYVAGGIPLLRSLNVRRNVIDPTDMKFISKEFHAKISKSKISPGDVVSVRTGNPGVTAVIPTSFPIANCADLIVMTCGASLVPQFPSEPLNILLGDAEEIQGTTGAIQTHFNIARARELVIPVPPLAIQKEFAVLVERSKSLRKVHRESQRQAEHLFQTLLHRAFTTGL